MHRFNIEKLNKLKIEKMNWNNIKDVSSVNIDNFVKDRLWTTLFCFILISLIILVSYYKKELWVIMGIDFFINYIMYHFFPKKFCSYTSIYIICNIIPLFILFIFISISLKSYMFILIVFIAGYLSILLISNNYFSKKDFMSKTSKNNIEIEKIGFLIGAIISFLIYKLGEFDFTITLFLYLMYMSIIIKGYYEIKYAIKNNTEYNRF